MLRLVSLFLLSFLVSRTIAQSDRTRFNRNDTRETLGAILSMLKRLDRRDSTPRINFEAVSTALSAAACAAPWVSYAGMCLIYNEQSMTWANAENFCSAKGGSLAWMKDKTENSVIRGFASSNDHRDYFWIGLNRNQIRDLSWSSGFETIYTGKPFTHVNAKVFAADSRDRQIDGKGEMTQLPSVCRRMDGESIGLLTIFESKKMDVIDEVHKHAASLLVNRKRDILKLAMSIQKYVECPTPWIRANGMCLMYIFQKRTWHEAQDLCTNQGGSLVWFENAAEHNFVRTLRWAPQISVYRWFWIGLFKSGEGNLIWVGHSKSSYRGSPLTDSSLNYFSAERESTKIDGDPDSAKYSAVCRRPLS